MVDKDLTDQEDFDEHVDSTEEHGADGDVQGENDVDATVEEHRETEVHDEPQPADSTEVVHDETDGGTGGTPHDHADPADVSDIQSSSDVDHDSTSGGTASSAHHTRYSDAEAADAAPVQSVNGEEGDVSVGVDKRAVFSIERTTDVQTEKFSTQLDGGDSITEEIDQTDIDTDEVFDDLTNTLEVFIEDAGLGTEHEVIIDGNTFIIEEGGTVVEELDDYPEVFDVTINLDGAFTDVDVEIDMFSDFQEEIGYVRDREVSIDL